MKLTPIPVEPIGHQSNIAFVERASGISGLEPVSSPLYPASAFGDQLRATRMDRDVGLREASQLLDLRASDISGLETGRLTLCDDEWRQVLQVLRNL